MLCRFSFSSPLYQSQTAHTCSNKVVYCSHLTADVYIIQETRDAILKGILQGSTIDSMLQWIPVLNGTNSSVDTLKPKHNCGEPGGAVANLRGERSSKGADGTLFSNFQWLSKLNLTLSVQTQVISYSFRASQWLEIASDCQGDRATRTEHGVPIPLHFLFLGMLFGTPSEFSPTFSAKTHGQTSPQKPI